MELFLNHGTLMEQVLPAFCISVSDPDKGQLEKLGEMGVTTQPDNAAVAEVSLRTCLQRTASCSSHEPPLPSDAHATEQHSQVIIIAVKPDVVHIVLRQLKPLINQHHLIISIAAGVTISTLQRVGERPSGIYLVHLLYRGDPEVIGQTKGGALIPGREGTRGRSLLLFLLLPFHASIFLRVPVWCG